MSKKAPKTTKPAKADTATPLTPVLAALLMFMDGITDCDIVDPKARYTPIVAHANAILANRPVTSMFSSRADHPDIHDLMVADVKRNKNAQGVFDHSLGDHHPITMERCELEATLYHATGDGVLLGAALMYQMLKGEAKR